MKRTCIHKGKFGFGSQIKMVENNVTRFEARIYKPLLEKLASHGEYEAQLFIPGVVKRCFNFFELCLRS